MVKLKRNYKAKKGPKSVGLNGRISVRSDKRSWRGRDKQNPQRKAQPLSPNDLDAFEDKIEEFRAFLVQEQRMREFLSQKPKAHLLLNHFVPFARQHSFLGLLDEQGDEALHSVWRRLEQWWKCMPDADQILQQLEHHFVSNWLLDTGRIAEMKQRLEDQKEDENFLEHSDGENDEGSVIDVVG
ncbi:hypothetical protein niasHS_018030 [Heterodera schachtii]|uniref:Uncharacterized protein n=1 Tax=Heterodera schachtii TaxID=97005 RepID=A0ABD2HV78_HETSC